MFLEKNNCVIMNRNSLPEIGESIILGNDGQSIKKYHNYIFGMKEDYYGKYNKRNDNRRDFKNIS